ncbi:Protein kinase domain-containing protein [Cinnamomum micranthum f. kanehirae]|uniref:Protein kinase domain-containing protein n=1 Tax=Cinnamomum micranthum f. kanehirae TaxID=337451 RepID=A0A3S3MXI8_9MAGN|nr:Protein kinase domain-containing protein [Cinnamomum micranthum f. kanehirae]
MNPKISDFGIARIFEETNLKQIPEDGYMSPEYAIKGHFSTKSDIFSFGVILLEIISGNKNTRFCEDEEYFGLLKQAWRLWNEEKGMDFIDPSLSESCNALEAMKCIQVGLLCVQEDPKNRPTIASVVTFLCDSASLPTPEKPPFCISNSRACHSSSNPKCCSINEVTISLLDGRCNFPNSSFLLLLALSFTAADILSPTKPIRDGETITSPGKIFELGFFSPNNSSNRYVGIWYHNIAVQTVVWVANSDNPVADSSGCFSIESDGNLVVFDGEEITKWSTNVSISSNTTTSAQVLDNGNLELRDGNSGVVLWQSFDHPSNTLLPAMYDHTRLVLDTSGEIRCQIWNYESKSWGLTWFEPKDRCSLYAACGAFATCNIHNTPICKCMPGFKPVASPENWNSANLSDWCVRKVQLRCGDDDRFVPLGKIKVPDGESTAVASSVEECRSHCVSNCSCRAYAYANMSNGGASTCLVWYGRLVDAVNLDVKSDWGATDLYIRVPASELSSDKKKSSHMVLIVSSVSGVLLLGTIVYGLRMMAKKKGNRRKLTKRSMISSSRSTASLYYSLDRHNFGEDGTENQDISIFSFKSIAMATTNFSNSNKLGQGGFGAVYKLLDWEKRFGIILGIARGLLYLHEDSRLRIVHRDLKASNILLDKDMNPKISDFGIARIFEGNQTQANTRRVIGTYGYMPPEYAIKGHFSTKSDIFSFGVILLEIISGKKNNRFCEDEESGGLLGHAWRLWNEDKVLDFIDPSLTESCNAQEVMKCIQVGLLCVQENPKKRPTTASVVMFLCDSARLPTPGKPPFYVSTSKKCHSSSNPKSCSINEDTISLLAGVEMSKWA